MAMVVCISPILLLEPKKFNGGLVLMAIFVAVKYFD